jgi:hypothetical protein
MWRDDLRGSLDDASPWFLVTAAVAEYAEILRGSYWAQESSFRDVLELAQLGSATLDDNPEVTEFLWLVSQARQIADG